MTTNTEQLINALTEELYYCVGIKFYQAGDGCTISEELDMHRWSDKTYHYKVPKDMHVEVGDFLVVPVMMQGTAHLKVVRVFSVPDMEDAIDYESSIEYKWIVDRVSLDDWFTTSERDTEIRKKVKTMIKRRQKEQALAALTEELGGVDEVRKLLGTYTAIESSQPSDGVSEEPDRG